LGQLATEEKSNEITAIPALLEQLDVRKAIITIDAMGCQKEIAAKIIAGKGDYVLAVKDNHPKLRRVIEEFFAKHLEDDFARVEHRRAESSEQGHGREEERLYYLAKLPSRFPLRKEWPGLKAIGLAVRITQHAGGKETQELRSYISSKYLSGARFANVVRQHWGIEALHWVLDVNFNEDQTRTQERRLANNLSWLRRFAIGLLKKLPGNESLRGKQRAVNWSTDVLTQLLTLQGS
jgi:predicted transposase YbfD/YdcC